MINAIAAIGKENNVIGNDNSIPWHISEDFKYFKETTSGHPIIMGSKTFETFPKPLPNRTHIVITRDTNYSSEFPEVLIVHSLEEAITLAVQQAGGDEIFIIGGGQIYNLALPFIERLYLTIVKGSFEGDVFFPDYSEFNLVVSSKTSSENAFEYEFVVLEK